MKLRDFYLLAGALGAVLPLYPLAEFIRDKGLDARAFIAGLHASPAAEVFVADVFVSALILVVFVRAESQRLGLKRGRVALLGLLAGVSLALPWFLYLRQRHLDGQRELTQTRKAQV